MKEEGKKNDQATPEEFWAYILFQFVSTPLFE